MYKRQVIDVWEKGRHSFTLEADSLVVFGDTAKLWKISLLIYQNGENFAKLIACSAYSYKDSDFVALGKVNLAYKDTVLYTDRLFYKKSSEKIYAPKVTIRTPNTITRGKNFVTDAGFRNFKLHEVFMDVKERR